MNYVFFNFWGGGKEGGKRTYELDISKRSTLKKSKAAMAGPHSPGKQSMSRRRLWSQCALAA
jgi:hypothetical protein